MDSALIDEYNICGFNQKIPAANLLPGFYHSCFLAFMVEQVPWRCLFFAGMKLPGNKHLR